MIDYELSTHYLIGHLMSAHIVSRITGRPTIMLAITPPEERVGLGQGQLWEREAERAEAYYLENNYRYTNQLTLSRSILINLRLSMQALNIEDEKPADLSRHLLNQNYRHLTVTRYDDVTGEPYYEENEAD